MPFVVKEIDIEHAHLIAGNKLLVEQMSHAHDAMEFFIIKDLPQDADLYSQFVKDLFQSVTEEFGGKTCVEIADSIQGEKRKKLHQALKESSFINNKLNPNVVTISRESLEKSIVVVSKKPGVVNNIKEFEKNTYQIVTDRQELLKRNDEFLSLLEKSGYLPASKVREGLYSELGMQRRILHPNALPVAIIHDNKIIGCAFLFSYADNTRIYVHDLTLTEEFRHKNAGGQYEYFGQAFFVKLYELAAKHYPKVQRVWLIGGGDMATAKLREHIYKDILGGESIVDLENNSDAGIYINFKPPGPCLLQAGQREEKQVEIKYPDGYSVKLFAAKEETLTKNDIARIESLEQQELQAREKNKLSASVQAVTNLKLGISSPSAPLTKSQVEELQQEKPEATTMFTQR